jgi:hypothetical protein
VTEKTQTLVFIDPETQKEITAKWEDLIDIYKEEQEGGL